MDPFSVEMSALPSDTYSSYYTDNYASAPSTANEAWLSTADSYTQPTTTPATPASTTSPSMTTGTLTATSGTPSTATSTAGTTPATTSTTKTETTTTTTAPKPKKTTQSWQRWLVFGIIALIIAAVGFTIWWFTYWTADLEVELEPLDIDQEYPNEGYSPPTYDM